MELVILPITEIHPYEHNSRIHQQEQIKKLSENIREVGIVKPILIDEAHTILAGHGVYEAAKLAGLTEIPCIINSSLTKEQKTAYVIADNRFTDLSHFDMIMVTEEMKKLLQADFDTTLTGFDDIEIEKLLASEVELAEKYADVIIKRYIEYKGSNQDVYLLRDGKKVHYAEISSESNAKK